MIDLLELLSRPTHLLQELSSKQTLFKIQPGLTFPRTLNLFLVGGARFVVASSTTSIDDDLMLTVGGAVVELVLDVVVDFLLLTILLTFFPSGLVICILIVN